MFFKMNSALVMEVDKYCQRPSLSRSAGEICDLGMMHSERTLSTHSSGGVGELTKTKSQFYGKITVRNQMLVRKYNQHTQTM